MRKWQPKGSEKISDHVLGVGDFHAVGLGIKALSGRRLGEGSRNPQVSRDEDIQEGLAEQRSLECGQTLQ